jgi:two-component system KDP operon response regulator KdpE
MLVDDGDRPGRALRGGDSVEGLRVLVSPSAPCIRQVVRRRPDLVLLQLAGDAAAGYELIRRIRSVSTIGIVTLGSTGLVEEHIRALDAGADDHLDRPFDEQELVARLRAVQRRLPQAPDPVHAISDGHDLVIDVVRHQVSRDGKAVHLTGTERHLLEILVNNPGVLLTHRVLLTQVWGEQYGTEANYLRVYMARLRKKLGDPAGDPALIATEPGVGYRWIGGGRHVGAEAATPSPSVASSIGRQAPGSQS